MVVHGRRCVAGHRDQGPVPRQPPVWPRRPCTQPPQDKRAISASQAACPSDLNRTADCLNAEGRSCARLYPLLKRVIGPIGQSGSPVGARRCWWLFMADDALFQDGGARSLDAQAADRAPHAGHPAADRLDRRTLFLAVLPWYPGGLEKAAELRNGWFRAERHGCRRPSWLCCKVG